jgi:Opacity family porin protein
MNRKSLISLTTAAIAVVMASGANAQETTAKPYSIGPAIEFSGGGTSFGIKGKIGVSPQFSVRPMVLFGYTPNVGSGTFSQAVTSGINNLTALVAPTRDRQIAAAIVADPTLNATTAAALLDKKDPTEAEKAIIATAQAQVPRYTTLAPEQQIAVVKAFSEVKLTDPQADAIAKQLVDISKIDPAKRTPEQNSFVAAYQAPEALNFFATSLTPQQQREAIKLIAATPTTDSAAQAALNTLNAGAAAQRIPADKRTDADKAAIVAANNLIAFASNAIAPGFTTGSGTAFGLAATYDFESADKKLSGYVGPRVMFANGSSKIGNFDTSTSETSIGLLVGADYAISSDLTAGLSATYNFSKSGDLSVTGPGGFKGSAPVSGSSFDVGVNFGYRF